jgi:chemotaxis protein MotB
MASGSRRVRRPIDVWPGYVDILAALLILVIFVLLVFSLAQFLLSEILSEQETELDVMYDRVVELTDLLGLEQERTSDLQRHTESLSLRIDGLTRDNSALSTRVERLQGVNADQRDEIEQQLLLTASLQEDIDALRKLRERLESDIGKLAAELQQSQTDLGTERDRSRALDAELAIERESTLLAQRDIAQRDIRIQALSALVAQRDEDIARQRQLDADARAEIALLTSKLDDLRLQLDEIRLALSAAESDKAAQAQEIRDLGQRLNVALAREVNQLRRYRSDFFGRLRQALGANPSVQIVGDRFVLPSELLFASGSATLGEAGRSELAKLVAILQDIAARVPADIDWILRIDGHTDKVPINTAQFSSNWSLSTARAVSVVRFLIDQGIPAARLSAAGFGEYHPLDTADTPEAYRRNRRIELKLTSR